MKISAKWMVALLAASMAFGVMGCRGKLPEAPVEVGQTQTASSGAEVSILGFEIAEPDFIDSENRALRPIKGQGEVAVLRIRVKNPTKKEIKYRPLHMETSATRIQICSDPGLEADTDTRQWVRAIVPGPNIYTPNQQTNNLVTIPPEGEITDEYLFEIPTFEDQLVALIPGSIVGGDSKTLRFKVPQAKKIAPPEPARLNQPVTIDGVEVKVTRVAQEYAELEQRTPSQTALKYPYAYTERPVMAVNVVIKNTGSEPCSYDPSHSAEMAGINMQMAGGIALKRIKLASGVIGKGQISAKKSIPSGESISDVYFFEAPASKSELSFMLSGHILGVKGIYRFALDYTPSNPPEPNLKPYENAQANDAKADDASDAAE